MQNSAYIARVFRTLFFRFINICVVLCGEGSMSIVAQIG